MTKKVHIGALRDKKAKALDRAIEEAGGPSEVAKFISAHYGEITRQAISNWRVCPPFRAAQVAAAAQSKGGKTTVSDLYPELFASGFPRQESEAA